MMMLFLEKDAFHDLALKIVSARPDSNPAEVMRAYLKARIALEDEYDRINTRSFETNGDPANPAKNPAEAFADAVFSES